MPIIPRIDPELKSLIPPLSEEEYRQLELNILSAKKCRDAIVLWDGVILDGHNRFGICVKHGIEFRVVEMPFLFADEAKLWIIENQLGRRNINDAMRIELALSKAELLRRKGRENQSLAGKHRTGTNGETMGFPQLLAEMTKIDREPVNVRKSVAAEAGVGDRTVQNYMQIKEHGGPELLEKVKSGELRIDTAHRTLNKEVLKQLAEAERIFRHLDKSLPIKCKDEANAEIKEKLIAVSGRIDELLKNGGVQKCE